MIQIPEELFAPDDRADSETAVPDFGAELAEARRAAALMQASAAASRALHDLDRSFDDADSDPSAWPSAFEAEVQRIRRDDLSPLGAGNDNALLQDFDDLAAAKLAVVRRLGATRELEGGRKSLQSALDAYADMTADASSDVEASILRDQAKATIARMDQAGFLRADEAGELERSLLDREESARVTRLIESDPQEAFSALSDPAQFSSLAPDARLRLRDRAEIRAEDAVRELAQAAERTRQGQIAGLMLRLDGGEADRADIMEAAASGWLSDPERHRALALWERQRQEIRQRENDLNRMKSVFAGEGAPLDMSFDDDQRALDTHYEDTKASWLAAGLSEEQLNPLIAEYLTVTNAMPKGLSRDISGIFRSGTPAQRLNIAELITLLLKRLWDWILPQASGFPFPSDGFEDDVDGDPVPRAPQYRPIGPAPEMPDPGFVDPPGYGPVPLPAPRPWHPPRMENLPMFPRRPFLERIPARDLAEGLLINSLIEGGWPRQTAPDRAAILLSSAPGRDDRFASADVAGFTQYLDGLTSSGRLAPQLQTQLTSYVAAPRTTAPAATQAGEPVSAGNADTGSGQGEAGLDTGPNVADASAIQGSEGSNTDGTSGAGADSEPKSAKQRLDEKHSPEAQREAGEILSDLVEGRISLADIRNEGGGVQIGAYTLAPQVADILGRIIALPPGDELAARAIGQALNPNRPGAPELTASQRTVLGSLLYDKVRKGDIRSGKADLDGFDIARLDEDGARVEQGNLDLINWALSQVGQGRSSAMKGQAVPAPQKGPASRNPPPAVSRTVNPLTKDDFEALPTKGLADPARIRTIQDTYSENFRRTGDEQRRPVSQMIEELRAGKDPASIEPIRIFEKDGKVYTLDHRRLIAARAAGTQVHFEKATPDVIAEQIGRKLRTNDDGMSIVLRPAPNRERGK